MSVTKTGNTHGCDVNERSGETHKSWLEGLLSSSLTAFSSAAGAGLSMPVNASVSDVVLQGGS
jgi:hypothetical protein